MQSAYSVSLGSTVLAGLTNIDVNTNPEVDAAVGIGSPYPQFAVVRAVKPGIAFQSRSIAAALAITGTAGTAINANPLVAAFAALLDGAVGSATLTYSIAKGLILPRRLQASHRGDATLDIEALAKSTDGATAPMTFGTGTPATLVRDNIRHTLKSVTVAGVTFDCLTDVSIDFGVNAQTLGCDSDVFDKFITKEGGITPSIQITTYDLTALNSLTLVGKRGAHADTSIVLRQYDDEDVGFVDNDITLTADGIVTIQSAAGQGPQPARGIINIQCSWDGTNAPVILGA